MKVFLFEFKDFSESSPECKPPSWQSRNPNDRCASQEPESVFFIKCFLKLFLFKVLFFKGVFYQAVFFKGVFQSVFLVKAFEPINNGRYTSQEPEVFF